MKKQRKPKKRNPQDATLRNIRALKKRLEKLERAFAGWVSWMNDQMRIR